MDLGGKLTPPVSESIRFYVTSKDAAQRSENPLVSAFRANAGRSWIVGTAVDFANASPQADKRRVLLFGDSYAHFDPTQLTGVLAETFRDVHFVWSTNVDWDHVEELRPDILICEMAERFLTRVPDDAFTCAPRSPLGSRTLRISSRPEVVDPRRIAARREVRLIASGARSAC